MPITKTVALLVTITAFALVGHAVAAETAGFSEADKSVSADTKPASSSPVVVPDDKMQSLRGGDASTAEAAAEERGKGVKGRANAVKGHPTSVTGDISDKNLEMLEDKIHPSDIPNLLEKKRPLLNAYDGITVALFHKRDQAIRAYLDKRKLDKKASVMLDVKKIFHLKDDTVSYYDNLFLQTWGERNSEPLTKIHKILDKLAISTDPPIATHTAVLMKILRFFGLAPANAVHVQVHV